MNHKTQKMYPDVRRGNVQKVTMKLSITVYVLNFELKTVVKRCPRNMGPYGQGTTSLT